MQPFISSSPWPVVVTTDPRYNIISINQTISTYNIISISVNQTISMYNIEIQIKLPTKVDMSLKNQPIFFFEDGYTEVFISSASE